MLSNDFRMAPSFHVAPDPEALATVARMNSEPLSDLCTSGGIYRGAIFRRIFATDPEFGRPYVTATDLEQAEVRPVTFLSTKHGDLLDRLALELDTIVISCSGVNLGKAFYVRPDMAGFVGSHDLIRVVADPTRVLPGYLFAYLDSRFGRSAIRQPTHGGSVRHIEPRDLADLPIPRLADGVEKQIHDLVFEASRLLADHSAQLEAATAALERASGLGAVSLGDWEEDQEHLGWSECQMGVSSLRPLNYDPRVSEIRKVLETRVHDRLGDLCESAYFRGKQVFKREEALPEEGVLLLGQRAVFRLRPEGRFISRRSVDQHRLLVPTGTVLIPSHGTLGVRELYCRAVAVTPRMAKFAFSGDFFRCVPLEDRIAPGYLYAFMRSRYAFHMLRGMSSGGKQQELTPVPMADFPVPRLLPSEESEIAHEVDRALVNFDEAVSKLTDARVLLETHIEQAAE